MNLKYFTLLGTSLAAILAFTTLSSNSGGNSSTTCGAGASCHGNADAATSVLMTTIPSLANGYVPNQVYACTLAVTNNTKQSAGFTCTNSGGNFSLPAGSTGITSTANAIGHNTPKAMTVGAAAWIFNWTAPSTTAGNITFIIGANAVNNSGSPAGDAWNSQTYSFAPSTSGTAPTLGNSSVTNITTTSASVSGSANANGNLTSVLLEYGINTSYGSFGTVTPSTINGNNNTNYSCNLAGLTPATTYHYRVSATSSFGNDNTGDQTFTTLAPQSINTLEAGGFKLYPNPVTNGIITIESAKQANLKVNVIDMFGNNTAASFTQSGNSYTADLSNLAKGNYFVRIAEGADFYMKLISVR
jgi:hypothetical protein